ncbi:phosphate ABC transporter permease PstA [Clostridium massiliamazoniense]|uniref:phosphate ABC transporter permease PstA n=1 Tax=Clostridium massiliamazoniense TaxID=1347366 RepID=UPI000A069C9A|nr:phosphate ABC transporter permease PstA [Clostridium massiliamazoniense]
MGKDSLVIAEEKFKNVEIKKEENLFKKYCENNIKKRKRINLIVKTLLFVCTAFGVLMLIILIGSVLKDGVKFLSIDFLTNSASRIASRAGVLPAIVGSLSVIVLTALIVFPVGIGAAIYIEEYMKPGKLKEIVELNIANLAGVPAIVYGIVSLAVFVQFMHLGRGVLTGALTLAILILPTIVITSKEALKNVPNSLREGSYALGVTKWQSITGVVLPFAMPGILTGTILSISRALGESSPLIMVGAASYVTFLPEGLFSSYTTLPLQIYNWTSRPQPDFQNLAASGIIVLLVVLLGMNAIAIILRNKYEKKI